jgi:hypothetical protein
MEQNMVMIESTELIDNLSLLLKMSQEFRIHETSKAYEDIIRLVRCMENEIPGRKEALNLSIHSKHANA